MTRNVLRWAAVAVVASSLALAGPMAANAHVGVDPGSAEPASYTLITFQVPNESALATMGIEIELPKDTPFAFATVEPLGGWTSEVVRGDLPKEVEIDGATLTTAPLRIVFTATGSGIAQGQFQQFTVQAGPVPDTGRIILPVTQIYSDGTVVNWNQPTPDSGEEPQNPAPTLYIQDAPPADHHSGGNPVADVTADKPQSAATSAGTTGIIVSFIALGLAALALIVGGSAFRRRRSPEARRVTPGGGA